MNVRLPDSSTLLQHNAIYQTPRQHLAGRHSIKIGTRDLSILEPFVDSCEMKTLFPKPLGRSAWAKESCI